MSKTKTQPRSPHAANGAAAVGSKVVDSEYAAGEIASRLFGPAGSTAAANDAAGDARNYPKPNEHGAYVHSVKTIQIALPKDLRSEAKISIVQVAADQWKAGIRNRCVEEGCSFAPSVDTPGFPSRAQAIIVMAESMISRSQKVDHKLSIRVKATIEKWLANFKRDNASQLAAESTMRLVGNVPGMATAAKMGIQRIDRDALPNAVARAMDGRWYIDCALIDRNPYQPRKTFDEEEINALGANILQIGLIDAVKVRAHPDEPGRWQLIDGERRLRAHRKYAQTKIAAERMEASEQQMMLFALSTFANKVGLDPLEHAEALALAARSAKEGGLGIKVSLLAKQENCSEGQIRNTIRLTALPEPWRGRVVSREMSPRHARGMLAAVENPAALKLLDEIWRDVISSLGESMAASTWEANVDNVLQQCGEQSRKRPKKDVDRPTPTAASSPARDWYAEPFIADRIHQDASPATASTAVTAKKGDAGSQRGQDKLQDSQPAAAKTEPSTADLRWAIVDRLREDFSGDAGALEACVLHLLGQSPYYAARTRVICENNRRPLRIVDGRAKVFETSVCICIDDYRKLLYDVVLAALLDEEHRNEPFRNEDVKALAEMMAVSLKPAAKPKVATTAKKTAAKKKPVARASSKPAKRAAKKRGGKR